MCQLLFSVSVAQETVVADALEAVRQHVADAKLAPQLAEIGVILLMFGVWALRTADEQIYIRGHGQPGETKISSGPANWSLTAKEVAKRLIESGLQRSFAGKIKCYNCHSVDEGIGASFAQTFADYMYYSKGYRSCEYWGYYGALDSYPGANDAGSKPDDSSNPGKTGESKGDLTQKYKTSLSEDGLSRASARRKLIIPKVPKELLAKLEKNLAKLKPF